MITLDGKQYRTVGDYTPGRKKSQEVRVTLGGKTAFQTFPFTDYTFKVKIKVYRATDPGGSSYGTLADLRTAYGKDYVAFVAVHGGAAVNVFMGGDLPEPFTNESIMLPNIPIEVELNLRQRQT